MDTGKQTGHYHRQLSGKGATKNTPEIQAKIWLIKHHVCREELSIRNKARNKGYKNTYYTAWIVSVQLEQQHLKHLLQATGAAWSLLHHFSLQSYAGGGPWSRHQPWEVFNTHHAQCSFSYLPSNYTSLWLTLFFLSCIQSNSQADRETSNTPSVRVPFPAQALKGSSEAGLAFPLHRSTNGTARAHSKHCCSSRGTACCSILSEKHISWDSHFLPQAG